MTSKHEKLFKFSLFSDGGGEGRGDIKKFNIKVETIFKDCALNGKFFLPNVEKSAESLWFFITFFYDSLWKKLCRWKSLFIVAAFTWLTWLREHPLKSASLEQSSIVCVAYLLFESVLRSALIRLKVVCILLWLHLIKYLVNVGKAALASIEISHFYHGFSFGSFTSENWMVNPKHWKIVKIVQEFYNL